MASILSMISDADRLAFSQNYGIKRNYVGDTLFPDIKTENLEAEYERLSEGMDLPTAAKVHALDTEAVIGQRPDFEKVTVEKLLIKEKINQSERTRLLLNHGVKESSIIDYVYDDMGRLADSVKTRTEIAKMEVLSTGRMTINENNVNMTINFGVNKFKALSGWADPEHDILGDIEAMVAMATDKGYTVNKAITSAKMWAYIKKNEGIQKNVKGINGAGMIVTDAEAKNLLVSLYGLEVIVDTDAYAVVAADGKTRTAKKFFNDNVFTVFAASNGKVGTGLWGITPEEEAYGVFTAKSQKQFITVSQWATTDPVAEWTKASGVFIPVLPNPYSIVIGTLGE